MIVDFRAYTFKPGTVQTFLEMFEKEGLPIQKRILGEFLGLYRTEVGDINEVIHMFGYESLADREQRRALLFQDPDFMAYVKKAREIITAQHVRILVKSDIP